MIGSVLGDNKEWDCCQQHSQGFDFSWTTGNEFGFEFEFQYVLSEKKGFLLFFETEVALMLHFFKPRGHLVGEKYLVS